MITATATVFASKVVKVPEEVLPDAEPGKTNKRMVSDAQARRDFSANISILLRDSLGWGT